MKRLIALLLVLCALPLAAQRVQRQNFASDFQTIPVVGNTPGAGATFQSFVAIMNPTATAFPVEVSLYDNTGTKRTATIALAAGELKTYPNFLATVFNNFVGGGAVTFRSSDPSRRFIVNSEVWTSGSRYGTTVPVLEFAGSNSAAFAAGISVDAAFRTNVGCYNQSDAANTITATVYDKLGLAVGTVNLSLAPHAWAQTGVHSAVSDGYVVFAPQEAAVCYAVVVTNSTNDGRLVMATEYEP